MQNRYEITYATLKKWEDNKLFDFIDSKTQPEKRFNIPFKNTEQGNDCLSNDELLAVFYIFHIFHNKSEEYQQVVQALNNAFANFGHKSWLSSILDATHREKNPDKTSLKQQAKTILWIMERFEKLLNRQVISRVEQYQEVMDLLLHFSRMFPRKPIENIIDNICIPQFRKEPIIINNDQIFLHITMNGFQKTFLSLFLGKSHEEFLEKIFSSPERIQYAIPLASCFRMLRPTVDSEWISNPLYTRLIYNHLEKTSDLYSIFMQFNKAVSDKHLKFTEELYQKIMHPAVLNNLSLVKDDVFGDPFINNYVPSYFGLDKDTIRAKSAYEQWNKTLLERLNSIISWNFIYQIYPCLVDYLPKEMIIEIISKLLLVTKNTLSGKGVVLTMDTREKRILFPLTDSMVDQLNEEDVTDIKLALSSINMSKNNIFNQLSPQGMQLLLQKLGQEFVQKTLFSLDSGMYSLLGLLGQMSLDCQKEFFSYIGSDYLVTHFTDIKKSGWFILREIKNDIFLFLLNMLGSLEYITNIILKTNTQTKSPNNYDWSVDECYWFLRKIEQSDSVLFDKSLDKLGKEWLITSNPEAIKLYEHLRYLSMDTQIKIIKQIGTEHLQSLFNTFEKLEIIFRFFSEIQTPLLELCGDAHIMKLAQHKDAYKNAYNLLLRACSIIQRTTNQRLDVLHIDAQFLLKMFPTLAELTTFFEPELMTFFEFENDIIIQLMDKMGGAVCTQWLKQASFQDILCYLPETQYSSFFEQLNSINALPSLEILTHDCKDKIKLFEALPNSIFELNPINLEQFKAIHPYELRILCMEKTPIAALQHLINHPDFIRSIPAGCEKKTYSFLLNKLGEGYLKTVPAIYWQIEQYLPPVDNQSNNTVYRFFQPDQPDVRELSVEYRPQ